jgi:Ca2+-binding RTX toxin-like protein
MNSRLTHPRRAVALAAVAAAAALAGPTAANAAVTGAVAATGTNATLTGDAANDTITIGVTGGLLSHNALAGFNSDIDFDSATAGDQTLPATASLTINGGDGDDNITGGPNDDIINGGTGFDTITGADGDDRITGGPGGSDAVREPILGGNGNDVMIWNNGDGSDLNEGEAGADEVLVTNGAADDQMAVTALGGGRTLFARSNNPFSVDMGTVEKLTITSFAGNDVLNTGPGVTLPMDVDAGPGSDAITTGDGADVINGGDDGDVLNGGAGGDRIIGQRGNDTMNGNAGDDTLVWNNGDGNDQMNGNDGFDRIENNLGAANDISHLSVVAGKVHYARDNNPFTLDVATGEVFELNTFGGDDTLDTGPGVGALIAVTADAGSGNDSFKGGDEADTYFGGPGNDVLDTGAGSDVADGGDGDDTLTTRDGAADLARGGIGTDTAKVDAVDAVDGVESVDRSKTGAAALTIAKNGTIRLKKGKLSTKLRLSCDASTTEGCNGTLTLLSAKRVKIGKLSAQIHLASVRYSLTAGQTRNVTVKLPAGVLAFAKKGVVKVKAQAVQKDALGNTTTAARNVSLKIKK